jgi:ubiquinone/menaquinone biosynthesis methyltransferase
MTTDTTAIRRTYTAKIFSIAAPVYPMVTRALSFFRDTAWKKTLVAALPALNNGTILDIACGNGDIALACAPRFPGSTVVCADVSPAMLARFPAAKRRNSRLTLQDMHALAIQTSSIDICTGGYALRNAPDLAATVAEIARVVRPGGVAAFLDFSRDPRAPVFLVHLMLLRIWGGLWGLLLHGNPRIYGYIAESLARFPDRKLLRALFAAHGFSEKNSCLRMFGMIEIVVFEKGQRP